MNLCKKFASLGMSTQQMAPSRCSCTCQAGTIITVATRQGRLQQLRQALRLTLRTAISCEPSAVYCKHTGDPPLSALLNLQPDTRSNSAIVPVTHCSHEVHFSNMLAK